MFRCLYGMRRILLTNLGLNHSLSRAVRFTWYVGADIADGLSQAQLQNKTKSNIFGRGYEVGDLVSVGCSRKGRVWSHRKAGDIQDWVEWAQKTGKKLTDGSISFQRILPHVIKPERLEQRPNMVPIVIEWSEYFLEGSEEAITLEFPGKTVPILDVGMELTTKTESGPIKFRLFTDADSVEYEVVFSGKGDQARVDYRPIGAANIFLRFGAKRKSISEWFQEEAPIIRFANGEFLAYNELCRVNMADRQPFAKSRIDPWDWTDVDLGKESQTYLKFGDSIQRRVIERVLASTDPQFEIVFDDDDSNEAADVVALGVKDETLFIRLYHCKFSKEDFSGARVKDLYEVCGQAQRSVFWKGETERLLSHLGQRDARRVLKHAVSRFERGTPASLIALKKRLPYLNVDFRIIIVQPGLSRNKADDATLDLLAATELYLKETTGTPLSAIADA